MRARELLEITGLSDRAHSKVSTFSGGMKRRLNIACALMHRPSIIIMDEPTVGIDLQSRELIYKILKEFRDEGHTIIYTSHYLDEFEKLCNRIAIMDKGQIIAEGTVKELVHKHWKRDMQRDGLENVFYNLTGTYLRD